SRQIMRGAADVLFGIVQHEVLKMHEPAVEPHGGAGVQEVGAGDETFADRARAQPLVEPRQRVLGRGERRRHSGPGQSLRDSSKVRHLRPHEICAPVRAPELSLGAAIAGPAASSAATTCLSRSYTGRLETVKAKRGTSLQL